MVHRTSLVRRARGGAGGIVALVAPAGFGKSTVLHAVASERRHVVWIDLDPRDDDVAVLAEHVGRELAGVTERPEPGRPGTRAASRRPLLDRVRRLDEVLLVLDDVHHLRSSTAQAYVKELVAAASPDIDVAVASRRSVGWLLAAARGRLPVVELGVGDLRLSRQEAAEVLAVRGPAPTDERLDLVIAATAGWPIGVALAAGASATARLDTAAALRRHPHLVDFVAHELLDAVDPRSRDVVLAAALLREFDDASLTTALDRPDVVEPIEVIRREGFRLRPSSVDDELLSFDEPLAELLFDVARRDLPEVTAIAARAARAFAQRRLDEPALRLALVARDDELVESIARASAPRLLASARLDTLDALLSQVPTRVLVSAPALALTAVAVTREGSSPAERRRRLRAWRSARGHAPSVAAAGAPRVVVEHLPSLSEDEVPVGVDDAADDLRLLHRAHEHERAAALTARERRVAALLRSRLTLRQIAGELGVSVNTVKSQTASIYRKLDVHDRDQLRRASR